MIFKSRQIVGKGRGKGIGYPTINLVIPTDLVIDDGVYAAWIVINEITYKGALHYGAIPTFDQKEKTLEVYLLDITDDTIPPTHDIDINIDIVKHLRDIERFDNSDELVEQIAKDVEQVRDILQ
jgi:riboflavin kinase/FMN adenylyltransferase